MWKISATYVQHIKVHIEGWKWKGSKCYWTKKQIELFPNQSSICTCESKFIVVKQTHWIIPGPNFEIWTKHFSLCHKKHHWKLLQEYIYHCNCRVKICGILCEVFSVSPSFVKRQLVVFIDGGDTSHWHVLWSRPQCYDQHFLQFSNSQWHFLERHSWFSKDI